MPELEINPDGSVKSEDLSIFEPIISNFKPHSCTDCAFKNILCPQSIIDICTKENVVFVKKKTNIENQMNMEDLNKDNILLSNVIDSIPYLTLKDILVKPLDPIKIKKEVTSQIPTGKKDKDGYDTYDTKTEVKDVDSEFGRGIVLILPLDCEITNIAVGNIVVYNKKFAKDFDLFKDSQLVKPYDIIALEK